MSTAAKAAAPLGSTTSFMRSNSSRIASIEFRVADRRNARNVFLDDWKGDLARRLRLQSVGNRLGHVDRHAFTTFERLLHVVAGAWLDAPYLDIRIDAVRGDRAPGEEAAAARAA